MTDQALPPRSAGALLRDRDFGPFLVGKTISSCGIWIQQVAAAVLMYQLTRSALMVGVVSAVQFGGPLVLALWAGALTDKYDRRSLLLGGRAISGTAVGVLALLLTLRGLDGFGGTPVLLASVLVMGLGLAISVPAMHALVPGLVPDDDLEQALALDSAAPSVARASGPALGAGLLLLGGASLAFAAAAATHLLFAVVLWRIRTRPQQREKTRQGILGGLRYVAQDRVVSSLLVALALLGFGADPVMTLTPSLADDLGGASSLVGLFASMFGVGAFSATLTFRLIRRKLSLRAMSMAGLWALGAGLAIVAVIPTIWGAIVGLTIAGFGFMTSTVAMNTRIQRRVPDTLRGRVMALWGVAFVGARPFAAPINGAIADLISTGAAFLTAAVLVVAASALARARS